MDEAVAVTECRMVLEGLCAAMTKAVADGEPLTYSQLNQELHARIQEFSSRRTAVELLERHGPLRRRLRRAGRPCAARSGRLGPTAGTS